jgi:phosphate transport system substrate-binding protein
MKYARDVMLTCPECLYNSNPLTATHCEHCGASLTRTSFPAIHSHPAPQPHNKAEILKVQSEQSLAKSLAPSEERLPSFLTQWGVPLLFLGLGFLGLGMGAAYLALREPKSSAVATSPQLSGTPTYALMQDVPNVPVGLFNYGGATCFAAMTAQGMHTAIAKAHPKFQLRYTEPLNAPPGCSTGIGMLLDGELSFAQNGRPLQDMEYETAKARGVTLSQIPVAIDGIVFFVNPTLPVSRLSTSQLQNIFRGKITNWKQVGGPDLAIIPISQDPKVHVTLKLLLGNPAKEMSPDVQIVRDYTTAMRAVASKPGGISYSSASITIGQQSVQSLALSKGTSQDYVPPFLEDGQVNLEALRQGTYPLTRRLFIVVRNDRTSDEQAGVAYANLLLSSEGQKIIEDAGFVPLR